MKIQNSDLNTADYTCARKFLISALGILPGILPVKPLGETLYIHICIHKTLDCISIISIKKFNLFENF